MATTTNYGFNKPTIGGSEDTWGADLNGNWDSVDTELAGIQADLTAAEADIATKVAKAITVSAGGGLTGGGDLSANRTISHSDTSSQGSVNNSGNTVIQDVTLDGYGHVTGLASTTISVPTVYNATIGVLAGGGMSGGGYITTNQSFNENITISHSDTSNQGSINNSGNTVIQDVTLDGYGHVTGLASKAIDFGSGSAGLAFGSVGTYAFAGRYLGGTHAFYPGTTYAGSGLKPAGAAVAADTMSDGANSSGYPTGGAFTLSGTWRAMGRAYRASSGTTVTLFLRIS